LQQTGSANGNDAMGRVKAFEYPADPHAIVMPVSELWSTVEIANGSNSDEELRGAVIPSAEAAAQRGELDQRIQRRVPAADHRRYAAGISRAIDTEDIRDAGGDPVGRVDFSDCRQTVGAGGVRHRPGAGRIDDRARLDGMIPVEESLHGAIQER